MTITCPKCTLEKDENDFSKSSARNTGRQLWCKTCLSGMRDQEKEKYAANARKCRRVPRGRLRGAVYGAKGRAKKLGIPFGLTMDNIPPVPDKCPCCRVRMTADGLWQDCPSLDRIYPENGYVPGNVQWLCRNCNRLKNNFSPEELMRLALFVWNISYGKVSRKVLSDDAVVVGDREYRKLDWEKAFANHPSVSGLGDE